MRFAKGNRIAFSNSTRSMCFEHVGAGSACWTLGSTRRTGSYRTVGHGRDTANNANPSSERGASSVSFTRFQRSGGGLKAPGRGSRWLRNWNSTRNGLSALASLPSHASRPPRRGVRGDRFQSASFPPLRIGPARPETGRPTRTFHAAPAYASLIEGSRTARRMHAAHAPMPRRNPLDTRGLVDNRVPRTMPPQSEAWRRTPSDRRRFGA